MISPNGIYAVALAFIYVCAYGMSDLNSVCACIYGSISTPATSTILSSLLSQPYLEWEFSHTQHLDCLFITEPAHTQPYTLRAHTVEIVCWENLGRDCFHSQSLPAFIRSPSCIRLVTLVFSTSQSVIFLLNGDESQACVVCVLHLL